MPRRKRDPSTPTRRRLRPETGKITLGSLKSDFDIDEAIQFIIRLVASKDMEPQVGNCLFYGFGMLAKARLLRQNAKFEERIAAYERDGAPMASGENVERPDDAILQ